jgi:alanine racemase
MSHFSDADGDKGISAAMALFQEFTHDLSGERSLCNSAAVLRHAKDAKVRVDWVRPGIALYGSSPDYPAHSAAHWDLKPVMSLNAAIIAGPCELVWWRVAMQMATQDMHPPARPCVWTVCDRARWAA